MLLKKIINFANFGKDEKIIENRIFNAYNTLYNKISATEFCYKEERYFRTASEMCKIKHINILRCISIDKKNKKIITERVWPFKNVFEAESKVFNMHCAYVLADIIKALHTKYKIGHNNICIDSFFINSNLNFVLGGFEMCSKDTFEKDLIGFTKILKLFNLPVKPLNTIISHKDWHSSFFHNLEVLFLEFSVLSLSDKKNKIETLIKNKKLLNKYFRQKTSENLINDLKSSKINSEKYDESELAHFKITVVDLILDISCDQGYCLNQLSEILDPVIRIHLLGRFSRSIENINLCNKAIESIMLGIKCKDCVLQKTTIEFFKAYYKKMNVLQKTNFIKSCTFLKDRYLLKSACSIIGKNKESSNKLDEEIRKFIFRFLSVEDLRVVVLPLIKEYYQIFSYTEICSKIILVLFELVRCHDTQDQSFGLIDLFLDHLKERKKDILLKNWNVLNIKSLFNRSEQNTENDLPTLSSVMNKKEGVDQNDISSDKSSYNDWNEDW